MSTTDNSNNNKNGGGVKGSSALDRANKAAANKYDNLNMNSSSDNVEVKEPEDSRDGMDRRVKVDKNFNPLMPKKVKVKPIPHWKNGIANNISESTMFINTSRSITLPLTLDNVYVNPFNSEEERAFFEEKLGVDLNPYEKENNFFDNFRIQIEKTTESLDEVFAELNLNDPRDYLKYLVCLANNEVENGKQDIYHPDRVFFIEDAEKVTEDEFNIEEMKDKIYEFRLKIKKDEVKLRKFLMVYFFRYSKSSRQLPPNAHFQFLYKEFGKLADDSAEYNSLLELIERVENKPKNFELEYLILEGINIGEVTKNLEGYFSADGDYLGSHLDNVITYLGSPKSQKLLERLKNQVKNQLR